MRFTLDSFFQMFQTDKFLYSEKLFARESCFFSRNACFFIKNVLLYYLRRNYYDILYAPVAQLDRASGYGPEGCGFDLCRARQML